MDLSDLRAKYDEAVFLENSIDVKDPIDLFHKWFLEAKDCSKILEPNAMCLATATKDGTPSARYVLLKSFGKEGFSFFTHYTSRKGTELAENPKAALTFYWEPFNRSVRIEGPVEKLPTSISDDHFNRRPYQSQLGAVVSKQSHPIKSREDLVQNVQCLKETLKEGEVQRPETWGGYLVIPEVCEFWKGHSDRLSDRIRFRRLKDGEILDGVYLHMGDNGWVYERLAP